MATKQKYCFTFGFGQAHPNSYVLIEGDFDTTRLEMQRYFGNKWSMQYEYNDLCEQMIARWNMKEVKVG